MDYFSKQRLRKRIALQTQDFLDAGGVIEQVPRVIFCPANMPWARERGWDYTPWQVRGEMGGVGGGGLNVFEVQHLEEGCFLTKPAAFEGSEDR
jgi:hypothetical protein